MEGSEDEEEVNYVQANDHQRDNQLDHNQHDHQQQYSFEEQFKQLYELSPDPERKKFLDDLFLFMTKRGTPVSRIPIMAKQVLDLYELYQLVVSHGGLVEVINKKIWREITKGLNLPSSITSAAFTLRTQYMKYLYPYECDREHLSTPEELQQAIDGNRREGRRSSHGHYSDMVGSPIAGGSGCSANSLLGANGSQNNGGPSISLDPLLPSAQAEALNLEVKPNINGYLIGLNNSMSNNQNNNSSSSLNSLSFNLENDTSRVNGNGNLSKDSNNNNNNRRDRGESSKRININLLENRYRKGSLHDNSGIDLTARNSSSSSSSSSTSHNHETNRNSSDDERLLINAGMPSAHIRITNRDGQGPLVNSLELSMEINNMIYSGVLHPLYKS